MIDYLAEDGVASLILNRPEKLNALNGDAWRLIPEYLARAEADDAIGVIVLAANGPHFCAGADILSFSDAKTAEQRHSFITRVNAAMAAIERCAKPVIAAVHGHVLGGGCELTMMSDIVIADRTARFGLPEIRSGIMPGPGILRGTAHASLHIIKYMALTGEALSAEEAFAAGLANKLVEAGSAREETNRIARAMAKRSPMALAEAKRYLNAQQPSPWDHLTASLAYLFGTNDAVEGVEAFRRKGAIRSVGQSLTGGDEQNQSASAGNCAN